MTRSPPPHLNPWVAFTGTISGIIGIPLSVFLTFYPVRAPDLTYSVYPIRTTVIQSDLAAGLRVLHNNEEITGNVTAAQVAIWNNGREPIVRENILTPIKIVTRPAVTILEATIRTQSRKEIEFSLDNRSLNEGVVSISWKILERKDGATVQLIYAGPVQTKIDLEGVIVGQQIISTAYLLQNFPRSLAQRTIDLVGLIFCWGSFVYIIFYALAISPKTWWGKIIAVCVITGYGFLAVSATYGLYSLAEPPFTF